MRDYTGKIDPNLVIPASAFPVVINRDEEDAHEVEDDGSQSDNTDEEKVGGVDKVDGDDVKVFSTVQLQAEDYGGGIALPHYGYRRPSADYFNSNMMAYNFVIADISSGEYNVYFYDERSQGKGADALCSLRLRYHLRK